jgi:putative hemolysin
MIHNVVELGKTPATRAMIPRTDMVCADIAGGIAAALKVGADTGYTRIPVFEGDRDHIVGVLHVTDLLPAMAEGRSPGDLRAVLRPARFWPENKLLDDLLQEMRLEKVKFGVLLDEHGGTAGLITIEDVLERIVGRLPGEHDTRAMPVLPDDAIRPFVGDRAEADADVDIDELNEKLGLGLPETPDYNSIGGLILHQLGRLPARGDSIEMAGHRLTVIDADERRIIRVRIDRISEASDISER